MLNCKGAPHEAANAAVVTGIWHPNGIQLPYVIERGEVIIERVPVPDVQIELDMLISVRLQQWTMHAAQVSTEDHCDKEGAREMYWAAYRQ